MEIFPCLSKIFKFRGCWKNKLFFLGMSENDFAKIMHGVNVNNFVSSPISHISVTDGEAIKPCCERINDQPSQNDDPESSVEEGNGRLVANTAEVYSEPSLTSKIELFARVINGWKPLTIFENIPILGKCLGPEYVSGKGRPLWKKSWGLT